jgi:3-oxoacyl-[acyl-carrier-protein] synthase-3
MNYFNIKGISLAAISTSLPEVSASNFEISDTVNTRNIRKVIDTIGIKSRYLSEPHITSVDLMLNAINKLLKYQNMVIDEIDVLICVTQTPDYIIPGNSFVLCNKLQAKKSIFTLDINLGCSGFTHGMITISKIMEKSSLKSGILVMGDIISRYVNPKDYSIKPVFGDGVAACLVKNDGLGKGLTATWGTISSGYDKIIVKAGGMRNPTTPETQMTKPVEEANYRSENDLYMNGADVFGFSIKEVPVIVNKILDISKLTACDIDYFVFHQANKFIVEYIIKKLNIPYSKVMLNIETIGNTGSASIPNAICLEAKKRNLDEFGGRFCFTGFGAGLSVSSIVINIDKLKIYN